MKSRQTTPIFVMLLTFALVAAPIGAPAQSATETIHGQIASVDDADALQVNDDRGFVDNVRLQPGTVINPRGARLMPGMTVTITGVNRGSVFGANQIDVAGASVAQAPPRQYAPPPPAPEQQRPLPARDVSPAELTGTLATPLDSKNAYVGQEVVLTNVSSRDGSIAGATLLGTVSDVTRAGQGRNAQIMLHFDSLRRANGRTEPIDGIVVSMNVKTKSNAGKEAGGAILGMLAGNALLKTLFGLSGGGIIGAIGGYMIAKDNRSDIVIPSDTAVTVQLVPSRRQAPSERPSSERFPNER
jgi:hypothetical protein